ncbi:DUF6456 domain-containing protein [Phyllobacterium myrsinacearum]|uniref:DUF6456 domain-containing protein n=1 Tax=Phyllobacterium myrsinacearum TaxID=28101 RepID=A0A839EIX2_9HYPH|nr:DUF6456 domain-containing protein [Phyllobacterium myrsinacearum]MBA8876710.1 hypothetical protein [Phyllobacterium myrsinacearum]
MTDPRKNSAGLRRLLCFLLKSQAAAAAAGNGKMMLESRGGGAISVERSALEHALRQGLAASNASRVVITDTGRAFLRRADSGADIYAAQHRSEAVIVVDDKNGPARVRRNDGESPLGLLHKRRDSSGRPLISEAAFKAGERLRNDYTLGNLMPALGVNWSAAGTGASHRSGNGVLEITDAALAARHRVERALEAVGPELSGVLVDVCCFLKGLEIVERERQWPVRSAKLILKTALAALDRHYCPPSPSRQNPRIIHWGADDYRPSIVR